MAWLVVDKQNRTWIHSSKPIRINEDEIGYWLPNSHKDSFIEITLESAENLIGKKLTWEDEPVEI